ncbi:MAG: tetratricopeptide repeat protein [Limisphaerales bacterium]
MSLELVLAPSTDCGQFPAVDAATAQQRYDDAMFDFSRAEYDAAIVRLAALLSEFPDHFDAQLALGMAWYRKGDYARAIAEGRRAEQLRPHEQLVHTNLSLFHMKAGDKKTAEHHGLQARIASWRGDMEKPPAAAAGDPELQLAKPAAPPVKLPAKLANAPWKKNPPLKPAEPAA